MMMVMRVDGDERRGREEEGKRKGRGSGRGCERKRLRKEEVGK